MKKIQILWTDDEIDLLKPHILFLEGKGYAVQTSNNGSSAIEMVSAQDFDLIFLDENMPGLSGLETLKRIHELRPNIPVIMITKSEEEDIMDAAIGSKIADYLIKPVNPNQILLSIKKHVHTKSLVNLKTNSDYQSEFRELSTKLMEARNFEEWVAIYKRLVHWELQLGDSENSSMADVITLQKQEADAEFAKFIKKSYLNWLQPNNESKPLLSPNVMRSVVFPQLQKKQKLVFIVIDNMRMDQWRVLEPLINEYYITREELHYSSILPTATQYARNALFAGLMPGAIEKLYPDYWRNDHEEGNKNDFENELLEHQMQRLGVHSRLHFEKIFNHRMGAKVIEQLPNLLQKDLVVLVYNFVDMLSHANTDVEMVRELASNDAAFRSLTLSWFKHSNMLELFRQLAAHRVSIVLTTDHGTIRVNHPVKVTADRNTSRNLRYKTGKSMSYNPKEVFEIDRPELAQLPKSNVSSKYIFTLNRDFIAYPNNYNHYVKYYNHTYQHGGISMEEMILPLVTLEPRDV